MDIVEKRLLDFLNSNIKTFNITYINDIELGLPSKRLYRFIRQERYYCSLGEYDEKVIKYFKEFGFNENEEYGNLL